MALIQKIDSTRADKLALINGHNNDLLTKYSVEEMIADVREYHKNCSFFSAVVNLSQQSPAPTNDTHSPSGGGVDPKTVVPPTEQAPAATPVATSPSTASIGSSLSRNTGSQATRPTTAVISSPIALSSTTQRIQAWVSPKGKLDPTNAAKLNSWMANQHIDVNLNGKPWVELLSPGGELGGSTPQQIEIDRKQAINDLHIP